MKREHPHPEQDAWLVGGGGRGAAQPEQRLLGWLPTWAGGPTGILWIPSRLSCGPLHGKLEPG